MTDNLYGSVNNELLSEVEANITLTSGESTLPFPAPTFYWMNGSPEYKPVGSVFYFGGWAVDRERFDQALEHYGLSPLNCLAGPTEFEAKNGNDAEVYHGRVLAVSIAAIRSSWISESGVRVPKYTKGYRRHIQALAMLADTDGKSFKMAMPVVLSAKGFQAKNLLGIVDEWGRITFSARNQYANGLPAWMFWSAIGTYGERVQEMVGSGTRKSPITPMVLLKPEITPERLQTLFGGNALLEKVKYLHDNSVEWQASWETQGSAPASQYAPQDDQYQQPPIMQSPAYRKAQTAATLRATWPEPPPEPEGPPDNSAFDNFF
jgi:hypothetical protein